jgi:membrane-associated phospholipid phosphatase
MAERLVSLNFIFTAMPTVLWLAAAFQSLWSWLDQCDKWLFLKLNTAWTNSLFDSMFPWWREANTWIPLYLFLILFGILNFGRSVWVWILLAVLTLVITDQVSSHLIKIWVARPRPCNDPALAGQVRLLLNNCSGTYGFTSSHAANHFGFAVFLVITLQRILGKWRYWFLVWAATVGYAQVYVGIHYPLDVIGGAVLGIAAGYVTGYFFNRRFGVLGLPDAEAT